MSNTENTFVTDLWGNRVYDRKGKKGRPPFEWTEENSNKVNMLLAMGWNNQRIADCILDPRTGKPISIPTLKRHFRAELTSRDFARDRLTLRRLELALQSAENGNVGGQRLLGQLIEANDMMNAESRIASHGNAEPVQKPVILGKKEENAKLAEDAESRLMAELVQEANAARPN